MRRLDAALSNDLLKTFIVAERLSGARILSAKKLSRKELKELKESIGVTLAAEASKNLFRRKKRSSCWFAGVSPAKEKNFGLSIRENIFTPLEFLRNSIILFNRHRKIFPLP